MGNFHFIWTKNASFLFPEAVLILGCLLHAVASAYLDLLNYSSTF